MVELFYSTPQPNIGNIYPIIWDTMKRDFLSDYRNVISYYRNKETKVSNTNPLVKLIKGFNIDFDSDIFSFIYEVNNNKKYKSDIISASNLVRKGRLLNGVEFGGEDLLFLQVEQEIDLSTVEDNWKDLEPLRYVRTTNINLDFVHPTKHSNIDLVIIEIDILSLMIQFYYWREERLKEGSNSDPTIFIFQYPMTNMISSLHDFSILSYSINIEFIGLTYMKHTHPFTIRDQSSKVERVLKKIIRRNENHRVSYEKYFDQVPTVFKDSLKVISLTNRFVNVNNRYTHWLARVDFLLDLINLLGPEALIANKSILGNIQKFLSYVKNNNELTNAEFKDYNYDVEDKILILKGFIK